MGIMLAGSLLIALAVQVENGPLRPIIGQIVPLSRTAIRQKEKYCDYGVISFDMSQFRS